MTDANIPTAQAHDGTSLVSVDYSVMQSHIRVDTAARWRAIAAWLGIVGSLLRTRMTASLAVFGRKRWSRLRQAASKVAGRRFQFRVQPAPRGVLVLTMLTAVSAGTALLSAPTVTTLLPPSPASRDAMADRLTRAEDSSSRQQTEIAGLASRLEQITDQQAATAILARQAADAAAQLETLRHDLASTAGQLRQDIASLQESVARLNAQHSSDEAQLTATLSRITSLADSLTAALSTASTGSPQPSQTLRSAGKPPTPR